MNINHLPNGTKLLHLGAGRTFTVIELEEHGKVLSVPDGELTKFVEPTLYDKKEFAVIEDKGDSELLTSVIDDMRQRESRGRKKYGTDMDRRDLEFNRWLRHAYEEALDLSLYLKKAQNFD